MLARERCVPSLVPSPIFRADVLDFASVKSRLDSSSGLSFTEFSYQLLQAYDFLTLHQRHNCTIQLGGSDQLGNILGGIDMIRKTRSSGSSALLPEPETPVVPEQEEPAYGLTMPLLTTAAGEKFGKSAGNAVWLDPAMTSPLEFYQFFYRTSDEEVLKYLKIFTFVRTIELEAIWEEHKVSCRKLTLGLIVSVADFYLTFTASA